MVLLTASDMLPIKKLINKPKPQLIRNRTWYRHLRKERNEVLNLVNSDLCSRSNNDKVESVQSLVYSSYSVTEVCSSTTASTSTSNITTSDVISSNINTNHSISEINTNKNTRLLSPTSESDTANFETLSDYDSFLNHNTDVDTD